MNNCQQDARQLEQTMVPAGFVPICRRSDRLLLGSEDEYRWISDPVAKSMMETAPLHLDAATAAYWAGAGRRDARWGDRFPPLTLTGAELIRYAVGANRVALNDAATALLVTTDDYLNPELAEINLRMEPWLLAKPVGHTLWIGPLIVPGKTACWSCLAAWLRAQRSARGAYLDGGADGFVPQPSLASLPTTIGWAAGLIATTVANWTRRGALPHLEDTVVCLDTRDLTQSRHVIRIRAECPSCGQRCGPPPRELYPLVSPITGLVSAMETTDKPVGGFYHAHAVFAPPLPRSGTRSILRAMHSIGKAITVTGAETACLGEAVERYSLIHQGDEAVVRATQDEVGGIAPNEILLFSDQQYQNRDRWNDTHSDLHWVPEPFDPHQTVDWVQATSLSGKERRFVPAALCYMHYHFVVGPKFCAADTNGCAASTSFSEARLAALLELIERDAVAIWWYNRLRRPALDLASIHGIEHEELVTAFRHQGRSLWVLDVTTDLNVPACVAVAAKLDGSEPCFGAAAGICYSDAVRKAVAEVAQICFWAGSGEGPEELLCWLRHATVPCNQYLLPNDRCVVPSDRGYSPEAALTLCVDRLTAAGIRPLFIDQTRRELGTPVVRAVAPGLRHFWARLAPGRLYDVPVRMGIRAEVQSETDMNPVACMI